MQRQRGLEAPKGRQREPSMSPKAGKAAQLYPNDPPRKAKGSNEAPDDFPREPMGTEKVPKGPPNRFKKLYQTTPAARGTQTWISMGPESTWRLLQIVVWGHTRKKAKKQSRPELTRRAPAEMQSRR